MSTDDGYADIVGYLEGLPQGAEVRWGSDGMSVDKPWSATWVDVQVPEIEKHAGLNWVWTILHTADRDADDDTDAPTTIRAGWDADLYYVWGPIPEGGQWFVATHVCPSAFLPDALEIARLHAAREVAPDERITGRRGAWTAQHISALLAMWALNHAGRDDIVFVFDPESVGLSPLAKVAAERAKGIDAGVDESFDAGDGIRVHGDVMDEMLALGPDEAAELMSAIKDAIGKPPEQDA